MAIIALCFLGPIVVAMVCWHFFRSPYEGTGSIKIERDLSGAPYVSAVSWPEVMFGYGYAIAEDRLWQMDINRRIAQGRLSALIGEKGLEIDGFMRNIRLNHYAKNLISTLDPDTLSWFKSLSME